MSNNIQNSINHKFVEVLSDGTINLNSNPLDEIELIQRGLDINCVEKFRLELRWELQSFTKAIGTNTKAFERYIKEHKRLNVTLSENIVELAHLASACIVEKLYVKVWFQRHLPRAGLPNANNAF